MSKGKKKAQLLERVEIDEFIDAVDAKMATLPVERRREVVSALLGMLTGVPGALNKAREGKEGYPTTAGEIVDLLVSSGVHAVWLARELGNLLGEPLLWEPANDNCLEGMACPRCGNADEFVVEAKMFIGLSDDGTDPHAGCVKHYDGPEYDDDSHAACPECDYEGKLGDFVIRPPARATAPMPVDADDSPAKMGFDAVAWDDIVEVARGDREFMVHAVSRLKDLAAAERENCEDRRYSLFGGDNDDVEEHLKEWYPTAPADEILGDIHAHFITGGPDEELMVSRVLDIGEGGTLHEDITPEQAEALLAAAARRLRARLPKEPAQMR